MSDKAKIDRSLEILDSKGISRSSSAPFLYRMMWAIGIGLPPPYYLGWIPNFMLSAFLFGPGWGGAMYLLSLHRNPLSPLSAIYLSVLAGMTFGIFYATSMRSKCKRYDVPKWSDFD